MNLRAAWPEAREATIRPWKSPMERWKGHGMIRDILRPRLVFLVLLAFGGADQAKAVAAQGVRCRRREATAEVADVFPSSPKLGASFEERLEKPSPSTSLLACCCNKNAPWRSLEEYLEGAKR